MSRVAARVGLPEQWSITARAHGCGGKNLIWLHFLRRRYAADQKSRKTEDHKIMGTYHLLQGPEPTTKIDRCCYIGKLPESSQTRENSVAVQLLSDISGKMKMKICTNDLTKDAGKIFLRIDFLHGLSAKAVTASSCSDVLSRDGIQS
jgi:hypothetical protein